MRSASEQREEKETAIWIKGVNELPRESGSGMQEKCVVYCRC